MAEEKADYLIKIGGNVSTHQADLTCNSDVEKLVNEIEAQDSRWVGLINNAGYFNYDNGNSFRLEELNRHMSVNFIAPRRFFLRFGACRLPGCPSRGHGVRGRPN